MTREAPTIVYVVGAGPGHPDLLTRKAARVLAQADVVYHDDLVPRAILDLAPAAEIVNVGKRCGAPLIRLPPKAPSTWSARGPTPIDWC